MAVFWNVDLRKIFGIVRQLSILNCEYYLNSLVRKSSRICHLLRDVPNGRKAQYPTILLVQILDKDLTNDELTNKAVEEPTPTCTKIIYATRTHSQLLQFAEEITKTRFSSFFLNAYIVIHVV